MTRLEFYVRPVMSADLKIIADNRSMLNGVVLNARLAENYNKACYALINANNLNYFIDPETPIFCLDPSRFWKENEPTPRDSYKEIATKFGPPILSAVNKSRPLAADDFYGEDGKLNTDLIRTFVANIVRFERQAFTTFSSSLLSFTNQEEVGGRLQGIIPPYFLLSSTEEKWYQVYEEIVHVAIDMKASDRLYVPLFLSESLLQEENRQRLIRDIVNHQSIDGIILWVNRLNEQEPGSARLGEYLTFIKELSKTQKEVVIFYGGFLTAIMAHHGVSKVCSGMQFWDYRDIYQAPGGRTPKRYYLEFLHIFRQYQEALRILQAFKKWTCPCVYCQNTIYVSDDPPLSAFKGHFLFSRSNEVRLINRYESFSQLKSQLSNEFSEILQTDLIENSSKEHIKKWSELLQTL